MTDPVRVWVDADACPRGALLATFALARREGAAVQTVSSFRHESGVPGHLQVDGAPQATDMAILARMDRHDIVVTQDFGLAALALARGGYALTPKGFVFRDDNIDTMLAMRADAARLRRGRKRVRLKGSAARTGEDDQRFAEALAAVLCEARTGKAASTD